MAEPMTPVPIHPIRGLLDMGLLLALCAPARRRGSGSRGRKNVGCLQDGAVPSVISGTLRDLMNAINAGKLGRRVRSHEYPLLKIRIVWGKYGIFCFRTSRMSGDIRVFQYRGIRRTSLPASFLTRGEDGVRVRGAGRMAARQAASYSVRLAQDFPK